MCFISLDHDTHLLFWNTWGCVLSFVTSAAIAAVSAASFAADSRSRSIAAVSRASARLTSPLTSETCEHKSRTMSKPVTAEGSCKSNYSHQRQSGAAAAVALKCTSREADTSDSRQQQVSRQHKMHTRQRKHAPTLRLLLRASACTTTSGGSTAPSSMCPSSCSSAGSASSPCRDKVQKVWPILMLQGGWASQGCSASARCGRAPHTRPHAHYTCLSPPLPPTPLTSRPAR